MGEGGGGGGGIIQIVAIAQCSNILDIDSLLGFFERLKNIFMQNIKCRYRYMLHLTSLPFCSILFQ